MRPIRMMAGCVPLCSLLLAAACGGGGSAQQTPGPGQKPSETTASQKSSGGAINACALLSQAEIAAEVGNPVDRGQPFAGPEVCKWDTEQPDQVSVLLTVRPVGGVREKVLCEELRKDGSGQSLAGVGEVAKWEYSSFGTLFNSGDLESCGAKGFVSLSLSGKRDEPTLKQAAMAIIGKVLARL